MSILSKNLPSSPEASTYEGFPEDQDDWNCSEWEAYFYRNKKFFGEAKAREIYNIDADNTGIFANIFLFCPYNCDFLAFTDKFGLRNFADPFSFVFCGLTQTTKEVTGVVTETAKGVRTIVKTLKVLAPIVIVAGVGIVGFTQYQKIKKKK